MMVDMDGMKTKLANFLANNPKSSLRYEEKDAQYFVSKPWGDDSFELAVSHDDETMIASLNASIFPERYSAIYHPSIRSLEVAYTVFKPSGGADIRNRKFEFLHAEKKYPCRFGTSSLELLHIAGHVKQLESYGSSNYRNLMSYNTYKLLKDGRISNPPSELSAAYADASPISFWIEELDWDDDNVLDLVLHLNFYMSYYDNSSPQVLVHTPVEESTRFKRVDRYPFGDFPPIIRSNKIDRNLLHLWKASQEGDPARRFLYNFQILEYSAYYMIEDEVSRAITRLLLAPNAVSNAPSIAAQIQEAFSASKIPESQKTELLLRKLVKADIVWAAIEKNKEFFCAATEFEGGFRISPILSSSKITLSDFEKNWTSSIASVLRNLRNALSHGKEMRMSSVITPTAHNMRLLQPWVMLISAAAKDVLVYRNLN